MAGAAPPPPADVPAGVAALQGMQHRLQSIYDVQIEQRVDDYLITDRDLARRLDASVNPREVPEKLLVLEGEEALELSLFVDAEVLARLTPCGRPRDGRDFDTWCKALEGVSHFVCLLWNARHRRSVSMFELELQAEVDKFVALADLLDRWSDRRAARDLHEWLFGQASFDHALAANELQRYRDANRYAGRYCRALGGDSGDSGAREQIAVALRRFYRLPRGEKLRHIEHLDG
jgi:hypothetical protein